MGLRLRRFLLVLATSAAAAGMAAPTAHATVPPAPEPVPDEGAAIGAVCPDVGPLPPTGRTVRLDDDGGGGRIECTYVRTGSNFYRVSVRWDAIGTGEGTQCRPRDGTIDSAGDTSSNALYGLANGITSASAGISFGREEPGAPLADWLAAAAALLAQIEPLAEPCPPMVPCPPAIGELTVDDFGQATPGIAEARNANGSWEMHCSYPLPEGRSDLSSVSLSLLYTPTSAPDTSAYTACLAEDEFTAGIHIVDGPGTLAIRGRITARDPHLPYDAAAAESAIVEMQQHVVGVAKDCAPLTLPELYTPLPAWLAVHLDPAHTEGRATLEIAPGGVTELLVEPFTDPADTPAEPADAPSGPAEAATTEPVDIATDPVDIATDPVDIATDPAAATDDGDGGDDDDASGWTRWLQLAMRIFGWVALALSVLGLALALFLIRRESRVRPVWDVVRIGVMVTVAVLTTIILGRSTPLPVVGLALLAGLGLGVVQGRHIDVRVDGRRVFARRNTWAIVAFLVGLVCSQLSGLLNRIGIVSVGIGLTVLSASLATGIVMGRRRQIASARALAATAVVAMMLLPVVVLAMAAGRAVVDAAPPDSTVSETTPVSDTTPDDGATPPSPDQVLAGMVDWTRLRLDGGYLTTFRAPPVEVSLPIGLATVPEPLVLDRNWTGEFASAPTTVTLQETYTFALDDDGVCCTATYAATGTQQRGTQPAEPIEAIAEIGRIYGRYVSGFSSSPFSGQETLRDDSCGRQVGGNGEFGSDPVYTTLLVGDSDRSGTAAPPLSLYTDCDLPGFDSASALAAAPPPPAADDPIRLGTAATPTGVACPVLQEVYRVMDDPTRFEGQGSTGNISELYLDPNRAACSGSINPGDERPGGLRNEFLFDLATADAAKEAARQLDARDDFDTRTMPWEIDPADQCLIDAEGIPRNGPDQTSCLNRSFHEFGGGQITIWTNTAFADGPDTIIRGTFPWGHYLYNCHHCEVGDPYIGQVIGQWHEFAQTWNETGMLPDEQLAEAAERNQAAEAAQADERADEPAEEGTSDAASEATDDADPADEQPSDETTDETDEPTDDDDVSAEEAAAVALIGLLGAAGIAATTVVESGHSGRELLDAYRRGGADAVGELLEVELEEPELPTDIVSGWDPYQETFRDMTRAERERLEAVDRDRQRAAREERYDRERAANRKPREDLERFIARSNRRAELEEALAAANEERARWEDPDYVAEVIRNDAYDGMLRDLDGLPGEIRELGRAINREMNDPENWQILRETLRDTAYDTAGLLSPVEFGDGRRHLQESARQAGRLGATMAEAFARDPVGFVFEMSPLADARDALDPERTLGQRLASLGAVLAEAFPAMNGASMARDASRLGDAARDLGRALDAADGARTGQRTLDRTGDVVESSVDAQRAQARARSVERIEDAADVVPERAVRPGSAGDRVQQQIERNRAELADDLGSPATQARREAWEANRRAGAAAVDDFADLVGPVDDLDLSPSELAARRREGALRVQTNKQGLQDMKNQPPEVRGAFIEEMRAVYDETDDVMRDWAVDYVNRQDTGRLADVQIQGDLRLDRVEGGRRIYLDDAGNEIHLFEPTNAKDPLAPGADRDFTMYVRPADSDAPAFSLPRDEVRPVYNDAFYDALGGDEMRERLGLPEVTADDVLADAERRRAALPEAERADFEMPSRDEAEAAARRQTRDAVAERLDQAVTDDLDPEAYRNVNTVINRPYGEIGDVQQVGLTMTHKGEEWQWRADHSGELVLQGDGSAGGGIRWSELSEDQRAEGIRQIVKQNGNQLQARQNSLQRQVEYLIERGDLPANTPIPTPDGRLDQAMEIMNSVKRDGVAPVDMEARLLRSTGMTPSDVARAAGDRIEAMEKLRPPEVRDLQRRMGEMADEMSGLLGREPTEEEVWMWLMDESVQ